MYQGPKPPWDIERPQRAFIEAADEITGTVLDAGCGTGENALFLAERGQKVTGVDFLEGPILQARQKAEERGLDVEFIVQDAIKLDELGRQFDCIIDSGLFHVFPGDARTQYVESLASVAKPGANLFLMCFSDKEPGTDGPLRISKVKSERPSRLAGFMGPISPPATLAAFVENLPRATIIPLTSTPFIPWRHFGQCK